MRKSVLSIVGAGLALAIAAGPALAEYPEKPVRIMLGFAAGGGADLLARWYADKLQLVSGGTFIVENKVGASGNLAADATAKARPDGYTILFTSSVAAGNPYVYKNLPFDVLKDLVPIMSFAETPFVLTVAPTNPAKSVAELTAFLKGKNGKGTYGWATTVTLANATIYTSKAGIDVTPVGYKVTGNAVSDVTAGQIDFAFADTIFASGQARQGRVKLLAVTSETRTLGMPEIPSMPELGFATGGTTPLWGVWAPTGAPQEILDKLSKWVNEITAMPATREFLISQGANPAPGTPGSFKRKIDEAAKSWEEVTKLAKIEPQ